LAFHVVFPQFPLTGNLEISFSKKHEGTEYFLKQKPSGYFVFVAEETHLNTCYFLPKTTKKPS